MRKPERLLKIVTLLQSRRKATTAAALAQRYSVSERTIYRDIQSLILAGIPVEGEAGVGYLLRKEALLTPIMFDENELEALILAVGMVQVWGDRGLGTAATSALDKIRASIPDRLHYLQAIAHETLLVSDHSQQHRITYSEPLRQAIKARLKVAMDYRDEHDVLSQRTVWPLGMIYWGKDWTLVAWCELRGDYRMFRVDRILNLETASENYHRRKDRSLVDYLENYIAE